VVILTPIGLVDIIRVSDVHLVITDLMKRGPPVSQLGHLTANQDTTNLISGKGPILGIRATSVLPAHTEVKVVLIACIAINVIQDLHRMQTRQTV
jgi:hypothetical protein